MQRKIIEFNGLPGSGKTTITNFIIEKNMQAVSYQEHMKAFKSKKKSFKKLILIMNYFSLQNLRFSFYATKFLISLNGITKDRLSRLLNLVYIYNSYKSNGRDIDYYLFVDQGLIQEILSIAHDRHIESESSLRKLIKELLRNIEILHIVNFKTCEEVAYERIKKRVATPCRLEYMSENKAKSILEIQIKNLNLLRNILENEGVSMSYVNSSDHLDVNASKIMSKIIK